MDVRSGLSFWCAIDDQPLVAPRLPGDASCEIAVIGGGITGALVAYFLVKAGVNTLLVDRGQLAAGSSAASTGLLQYEVDTPLDELIAKVGEPHAVHAYRRGQQAVDEIEQIVGELPNDCGFSRHESLYFSSSRWHYRRVRREFECRRKHGFDVSFLERDELAARSSISATGAILSQGDAQINPFRFTQELLRAAMLNGLRAYADTAVEHVRQDADGVLLRTPHGKIAARKIVYATGYESHKYLKQDVGSLHSTYCVVSEPLTSSIGWPDDCLLWESARPYFYARKTADGRAMIGGEDTTFSDDHERDGLVDRKVARLQKRFSKLFPAIEFVPAYAWAGTFAETKDGLAYIGQPDDQPNAYFALGYGGNGITFSMIAAKLIVDLFFQRTNADAEVFRFGR